MPEHQVPEPNTSISPAQLVALDIMLMIPNGEMPSSPLANLSKLSSLAVFLRLQGLSNNTILPITTKRKKEIEEELGGLYDGRGIDYDRIALLIAERAVLTLCEDDPDPLKDIPNLIVNGDAVAETWVKLTYPYFPDRVDAILELEHPSLPTFYFSSSEKSELTENTSHQERIDTLGNDLFRPMQSHHGYGVSFGDDPSGWDGPYADLYYPEMVRLVDKAKKLQEVELQQSE